MNQQDISIYERIILESIYMKEKSFNELYLELGLKQHILQAGLNSLVLKNLIKLTNKKYVSKLNSFEFKNILNTPQNIKKEISFLQRFSLEQTVNHNKSFLKLRKVYLNSQEKSVLKAMLNNLEEFVNSTSKSGDFKNQNLVYWCNMPMSEIIDLV